MSEKTEGGGLLLPTINESIVDSYEISTSPSFGIVVRVTLYLVLRLAPILSYHGLSLPAVLSCPTLPNVFHVI